jgi:hypothetical protein
VIQLPFLGLYEVAEEMVITSNEVTCLVCTL